MVRYSLITTTQFNESDAMTQFHHIRLELAREPGHPAGAPSEGYDIVAPLDGEGRLDGEALRGEAERGHVRRFSRDETVSKGQLRQGPGGRWILDMEDGDAEDAVGFRFGEECFVVGEYVSLSLPSGDQHTYVVARVVEV
ncbi:MAG: hypothetical protein Q8J71_06165 [Brevundimonas sp.]|nr:hypothetical protein [Brevundimonas sp.]